MFKKLRDIWEESKAQVEAEMKAEAENGRRAREGSAPSIPRAADMPFLAAEFLMNCHKQGVTLLLRPESLPKFDELVSGARGVIARAEAARDPGAHTLIVNTCAWMSAYLGELLCKQVAGVWADVGHTTVVRVYGSQLDLREAIAGLLRNGTATHGDRSFDSASAYYAVVVERVLGMLDRAVYGNDASFDEVKAGMADDPDLAERLAGTVYTALTTGSSKWNVTLDFSLESVKSVESILDRLHIMTVKAAPDQKPSEEQIAGAVGTWGVYVGEVMRRAYGGRWSNRDGALTLTVGEVTCWPTQKVRKRLEDGEGDGIPFYVHVTGKMARGGPGLTDSRT